jgi:hypothetical protein
MHQSFKLHHCFSFSLNVILTRETLRCCDGDVVGICPPSGKNEKYVLMRHIYDKPHINRVPVFASMAATADDTAIVTAVEQGNVDALLLAAKKNDVDVARLLLDHDPNIEHQDSAGCTALHYASDRTSIDVARLLLDHGANVKHENNRGWTALFYASDRNSVDVARLLLDRGANIEHTYNRGWTALLCASKRNSLDAAQLLLNYDADIEH